jgi:nicotinate-nucleotide adenylyltransferase
MQKIGIFGGTFDPFHNGHLSILKCCIEQCELDKCFIVPAKCSPFKVGVGRLYSDTERLNIIQKNIISVSNLELCRYEIDSIDNVSYSVDTIKYFRNLYNNADLYLLVGYDVALNFDKWKNYKEILDMVKVVIAARGNKNIDNDYKLIEIFGNKRYILLDNPIVDITSTKIRAAITNKQILPKK